MKRRVWLLVEVTNARALYHAAVEQAAAEGVGAADLKTYGTEDAPNIDGCILEMIDPTGHFPVCGLEIHDTGCEEP